MTYEEYLAAERSSPTKHEYLRGEVYAMAGGTPTHAGLAMAVGVALSNALAGRPCRVFGSDLRVRVEATDLSTYPDVTVICGQLERSEVDADAALNPTVIVEVLSDSTEAYDRGEKFAHYRRIPSLREYLLVSQHEPRIEAYAKNDEGAWVLAEAGAGQALALRSLPRVELRTDDVYRDPLAGA
ncbi:MAG: Uma2 family endonuclease [Myxococcales bacterium]|nr:Uma2 family endonuclease [Myxococcales bacterium]